MLDTLAFAAIGAPLLAALALAALALTARPIEPIAIPAARRPAHAARAPERRAIRIATLGALLALAADIAALIADKSKLTIDRHQLVLESPIKTLGSFEIPVKLHPAVEASVTVRVVAADGEGAASDSDEA